MGKIATEGLVEALWVGPGGQVTADGINLIPGETIRLITAGEAEESDNWSLVPQAPDTSKKTPKGDE